ncbi:MAG: lysylphosphatidylglycerol synthase domain-containing protein [Kofleriaceae bacterium]
MHRQLGSSHVTTTWRVARVGALGVGLVLMAILLARLGPRQIAQHLREAGAGSVWLLIAYAAGTTISALPWHIVMPRQARPGVSAAITSRFAAAGANTLLPLFGLGGELVRLFWLRPGTRAAGLAAVVVDRLLYAIASAVFLLGGVIVATRLIALPHSYTVAAAVCAIVLLVISCGVLWIAARHRMAQRVHAIVQRLRRSRTVAGNGFTAKDVDAAFEDISGHRARIAGALAVHVVARVVLALEIYAGFAAIDVTVSWDVAVAFAAVPVALGFIGGVVPSQIGIQEGTQALIASALGIPPATAVTVVLLTRMRQLITAGIAWLLIAAVRKPGGSVAAPTTPSPTARDNGG